MPERGFNIAAAVLAFACGGIVTAPAGAAVAVVANRQAEPVRFSVFIDDAPPRAMTLEPGDARPLFAERQIRVQGIGQNAPMALLKSGSAYLLTQRADSGHVVATHLRLGETGRGTPDGGAAGIRLPGAEVIRVKIAVDDNEYRPQGLWEPTLRARVDRASEILTAHAGVKLQVVGVEVWDSDDAQGDFIASLEEFEREVSAAPADVVIGFSSQYQVQRGRFHMGGTRGPLRRHILLKERADNTFETERLALLVHELGHYLGATHSPQSTSVMRPVLRPGEQRSATARIRFDPANTLLIALVGDDMARRRARELTELSELTKHRLAEIYGALEPGFRKDPATAVIRRMLAGASVVPVIEDSRKVLAQIVRVAKLRRQLAATEGSVAGAGNGEGARSAVSLADEGDALTEFYVRQAALAAKQVRRDTAPRALLIALGVAVDDPRKMAKIPVAGTLLAELEGRQQQADRVEAVGEPTMRGRVDLARHFFVSAELVALGGSDFARGSGVAKEAADSRGGSGFSFADIAANEAGIAFAEAVLSGQLTLDDVAARFTVEGFMPPVDGLREHMQAAEFAEAFGSTNDGRFHTERAKILQRISELPGYRVTAGAAR